jgi:hypothetical protein
MTNQKEERGRRMYEKPELTRIGDAEDVILGIAPGGLDLDMNWISAPPVFEADFDPEGSFDQKP